MNATIPRVVIYTKDIMRITGCSSRTARRKILQIRQQYNKKKGAYISIVEFSRHTGLPLAIIKPFLT